MPLENILSPSEKLTRWLRADRRRDCSINSENRKSDFHWEVDLIDGRRILTGKAETLDGAIEDALDGAGKGEWDRDRPKSL